MYLYQPHILIASGEQQMDSAIHVHVSIVPQIPPSSSLLRNIEQSSVYYTVGLCWLSILNIAVRTCQYQTSKLSFPPDNHKFTL